MMLLCFDLTSCLLSVNVRWLGLSEIQEMFSCLAWLPHLSCGQGEEQILSPGKVVALLVHLIRLIK